jgi:hypothetical protein
VSNSHNFDNPFASGEPGQPVEPKPDPAPFSARVPERFARGAYSPAQVVVEGPREFVIDFLQGLTRPYQVTARVVLTPQTFNDLIDTLQRNLEMYTQTFGPPPTMPANPPSKLSMQEIYDHFKLPDELLSGAYANQVMIGHSVTDFAFDFITTFYPTTAVSTRVYVPAAIVPRFLTTLRTSAEQFRKRVEAMQQQQKQIDQQPGTEPGRT